MGNSSSSSPSEEKAKILASNINNCNNPETKWISFLPQENRTALESALEKGRLDEALFIIDKIIEDMDNALLNIALTGRSGAGKSTFINAFRGVWHEDKGAATTGVLETTTDVNYYEYPELSNVKLWDLPSIGTYDFQSESYLEKVNFSCYDFFLIISSSRFRVNDVKLAKEIRQMGKKFYFVRTKVDIDLYNERRSKPKTFKKENVLQRIQKNCLQRLQDIGIAEPEVYLISSFELESYDFPKLRYDLVEDFENYKIDFIFRSLPNILENIIDQKKANIQAKIWEEALKTGVWAFVPFVGIFKEGNFAQLEELLTDYQRKFGVDDASLLKISQASNKPLEEIKLLIKSTELLKIKEDEHIFIKIWRFAETFNSVNVDLIATGHYFRMSYYTHLYFLEKVAKDAKTLLQKLWEISLQRTLDKCCPSSLWQTCPGPIPLHTY
ncbi:T-cell-specific guanine nucleotide triphosphate-binding protein 2-like [Trichosurus vulpecula]|uniref:T-cell-specific guanine nucleotide triphosphate-binding protein 2-like n=1 Tax=Trichosurus vulpecula TaxID=9337 RepID=UPI00186AFFEA|nr:T-cell-specific guanine nucleotide triphosphate-binding protein 2-like [Trichosurus vulpecula]